MGSIGVGRWHNATVGNLEKSILTVLGATVSVTVMARVQLIGIGHTLAKAGWFGQFYV